MIFVCFLVIFFMKIIISYIRITWNLILSTQLNAVFDIQKKDQIVCRYTFPNSSTGTEEIVISSEGTKSGVCTFTVSIMIHYHLEECTIGHARLMGLANPVDFLNPHNAMHDDHT